MVKNRNTFNKNTKPVRRNGLANTKLKTTKRVIAKPKRMVDARQKIIQKKRTTVVDARDVLTSMAKTQDARTKLQKLRGEATPKASTNVKQIGKHILQKTDKNGRISLVTNKNKAANNINNKIREQLGINQRTKKQMPKRKEAATGPLQLRRTISNDYFPPSLTSPTSHYPHEMYGVTGYAGMSPMMPPMEIRRPVMDMMSRPAIVNDASSGQWKSFPSTAVTSRSNGSSFMDVDSDDDVTITQHVPKRPGLSRMTGNVHARLDSSPVASHGILAQPKTKVVVPAGHRIVVSNLQSTVTQDDIRELFEDIGQLLVARLVRPGTAEVIYKNLKDAQKAVDTYHNRQLDGQPMKCLLVNKRPLNNPTAPAIKSNDSVRKAASNAVDKLVPDLSTIHKVLFQRH